MTVSFLYMGGEYQSVEQVEAQAQIVAVEMTNKPSLWCVIKPVQQKTGGSLVVSADAIPDQDFTQIAEGRYLVASKITGENVACGTAESAINTILRMRKEYADYMQVNTVSEIRQFAPESVNMAQFLP